MIPPQEMCLVSEPGAGARYMSKYDGMHPSVRQRIRESPVNMCLACLELYARCTSNSFNPTPQDYIDAIRAFETGAINDNRSRVQGPGSFETERSVRSFYVTEINQALGFNDPRSGQQGNPRYSDSREFRGRMGEWSEQLRDALLRENYIQDVERLKIDWGEAMTEFYISFASDNTFLGGTVVAARTPTEALEVATSLGRNPGGEAAILEVPSLIENEPDIAVLRTKLVGKEEMLSLGGVKQGDLPESQQELINSAATKICGDCND